MLILKINCSCTWYCHLTLFEFGFIYRYRKHNPRKYSICAEKKNYLNKFHFGKLEKRNDLRKTNVIHDLKNIKLTNKPKK